MPWRTCTRCSRARNLLRVKMFVVVREPVSRQISAFNQFFAKPEAYRAATYNTALFEEISHRGMADWQRCALPAKNRTWSIWSMRIYTICRFRTQLADGLFWPQLERWQASRLGDTVFARPFAREQFLVMSLDQMRDSPALFQQPDCSRILASPRRSRPPWPPQGTLRPSKGGWATLSESSIAQPSSGSPRSIGRGGTCVSSTITPASVGPRRCGTSARQRPLRARRIPFRVKWNSRKHTVPAARKLSPQQMKERKKENRQPKGGMGGRHAATTQGF